MPTQTHSRLQQLRRQRKQLIVTTQTAIRQINEKYQLQHQQLQSLLESINAFQPLRIPPKAQFAPIQETISAKSQKQTKPQHNQRKKEEGQAKITAERDIESPKDINNQNLNQPREKPISASNQIKPQIEEQPRPNVPAQLRNAKSLKNLYFQRLSLEEVLEKKSSHVQSHINYLPRTKREILQARKKVLQEY